MVGDASALTRALAVAPAIAVGLVVYAAVVSALHVAEARQIAAFVRARTGR